MADRPILFSAPMIRALLDGRKSQTRRLPKVRTPDGKRAPITSPNEELIELEPGEFQRGAFHYRSTGGLSGPWPLRFAKGDRLWVKHASSLFPVYFKPILGWEGLYSAGTDGFIYRMDGTEPSVLKGSPSSKGYLTVSLSCGEWETVAVHKIICATFYGASPFDRGQVRHLNGCQTDNRPVNLDWGTQEHNWEDRKAHGKALGADHHAAKLNAEAVREIRSSALSQRALARKYGVSQSTIGQARNGETWQDGAAAAPRNCKEFSLWQSSIHMPRWASRLTLTVTDVRVHRLQEISEADAIAEGARELHDIQVDDWLPGATPCRWSMEHPPSTDHCLASARWAFANYFAKLNGEEAWNDNPWCAAISFTVERRNIDA